MCDWVLNGKKTEKLIVSYLIHRIIQLESTKCQPTAVGVTTQFNHPVTVNNEQPLHNITTTHNYHIILTIGR
jgi:hypothetical protein